MCCLTYVLLTGIDEFLRLFLISSGPFSIFQRFIRSSVVILDETESSERPEWALKRFPVIQKNPRNNES